MNHSSIQITGLIIPFVLSSAACRKILQQNIHGNARCRSQQDRATRNDTFITQKKGAWQRTMRLKPDKLIHQTMNQRLPGAPNPAGDSR